MNVLAESYDKAYESARKGIDGTIGLFDTMATETKLSIDDMLGAMQSQVEYLELYQANLQKALEYDLDPALISTLSDGSTESAGYINAIIGEVERLSEAGEDTAAFVNQFNSQFQQVETAKDEFAGTVAEMETGFSKAMDEIEGRMVEAVDNMNMEADAAQAAKDTIDAYVKSIRDGVSNAESAASSVANAATKALVGNNISLVGIPGYATGTTDAPDMFIAGEQEPELIVGARGSTVFPAEETSEILAAATQAKPPSFSYPAPEYMTPSNGNTTVGGEITHLIKFEGGEVIQIDKNANKEQILEIMVENMRPVLMGIIRTDIFEEGDRAYVF